VKRSLIGVCLSALIALALPAYAIGDSIAFAQTSPGTVSAVLSGSVDPCAGSNIFPMGVSSVSLSGNRYDITSAFAVLDPPHCPFSQSYSVPASLGAVPDGQYNVVWTAGPLVVTGAFSVRSGLLQFSSIPVPTLERSTMILLITLIASVALALIRRNP
jgi:hypothetical protein